MRTVKNAANATTPATPLTAPAPLLQRLRARKGFWLNGAAWIMGTTPDTDCAEAADEIMRLRNDAMLFATELRDRHIQIKIDRHGDVFGQYCVICEAEDAQPHKSNCIVGKALAFIWAPNVTDYALTLKPDGEWTSKPEALK